MSRPGDDHARADVESGIYERHYQLQPGDIVLDIGAHVGFFTAHASLKVGPLGQVIAFEPHPENFALLRERVGALSNVALIHAAACDKTGLVKLYHNSDNSGGHSLFPSAQHSKHFTVPCVSASRFIGWQQHVRFVKCDVEGAEIGVLRDLVEFLRPPVDIAFEAHNSSLYAACKEELLYNQFEFDSPETHVGVCYAWRTSLPTTL